MNFVFETLGYSGVIPAAISLSTVVLFRRFATENASDRYAVAVGFAIAFFAGYALLPSWAPLEVARHWHWLPYLAAVAMVLGPLALANGIHPAERGIVQLLLALLAAWLLVPTWPDLQPSRPVYIAFLTGYLLLLSILLDLLISRLPGPLLLVQLALVAIGIAILLAVFSSLKFGQIAGIAAAALAGCAGAAAWCRSACNARGLVLGFVVILGGSAFVGYLDHQPPLTGLLLVPAAPLALWICLWGPLRRQRSSVAAATQTTVVLVPIIVAFCLLFF